MCGPARLGALSVVDPVRVLAVSAVFVLVEERFDHRDDGIDVLDVASDRWASGAASGGGATVVEEDDYDLRGRTNPGGGRGW